MEGQSCWKYTCKMAIYVSSALIENTSFWRTVKAHGAPLTTTSGHDQILFISMSLLPVLSKGFSKIKSSLSDHNMRRFQCN